MMGFRPRVSANQANAWMYGRSERRRLDSPRHGLSFARFRRRRVVREVVFISDLETAFSRQAQRVAETYDDPVAGEYARGIFVECARAILENLSAEGVSVEGGIRPVDLLRRTPR